jgi:hypothetical protein
MFGGGALTRVETMRQTSVQATGRMPLCHAPAHSVVQLGEWDLCLRALPAERCRVAAVWVSHPLLDLFGRHNSLSEAVTRSA